MHVLQAQVREAPLFCEIRILKCIHLIKRYVIKIFFDGMNSYYMKRNNKSWYQLTMTSNKKKMSIFLQNQWFHTFPQKGFTVDVLCNMKIGRGKKNSVINKSKNRYLSFLRRVIIVFKGLHLQLRSKVCWQRYSQVLKYFSDFPGWKCPVYLWEKLCCVYLTHDSR